MFIFITILVFQLAVVSLFLYVWGDMTLMYSASIVTTSLIFLIISSINKRYYDAPIEELELTIKKFLVWSLKDEKISLKKSTNPHLNYITLFFNKTLNTLKNIKSEFLHGKEIRWEVDLAREIQEKLLQKKLPEVPHLEIVWKSIPAGEIGGDSFDVISQGDNHYIYVGDATGHGVWAGFIMMMVNSLVGAYAKVTEKWNHILALTNDIIKPRVKANLLMSILMIRWNEKEKKMYMTGAWHEYLMIYKHKQQKCLSIKSGWIALGMTKNIHKILKERQISFEENDVIILYSDGITEAINRPEKDGNEQMFGENFLIQAIENSPKVGPHGFRTARSIFRNISIQLSGFMGYKHTQLDDITLMTVQYKSKDYKLEDDCSELMGEYFTTEWSWEK